MLEGVPAGIEEISGSKMQFALRIGLTYKKMIYDLPGANIDQQIVFVFV